MRRREGVRVGWDFMRARVLVLVLFVGWDGDLIWVVGGVGGDADGVGRFEMGFGSLMMVVMLTWALLNTFLDMMVFLECDD